MSCRENTTVKEQKQTLTQCRSIEEEKFVDNNCCPVRIRL